jgi:transposase InsO family protein
LKEFNLNSSSFYRSIKKLDDKDNLDYEIIEKHFSKNKRKAGIRQLKMIIERKEGLIFNRKKIARIKKKFKLETEIRRVNKYKKFRTKNEEHKICANHLNRNFKQSSANRVYSIDITQVKYAGKKAYIAAVKDLYTKEIVAKEVSSKINLELSNNALEKALRKLSIDERKKLMVHSDQGFHFTHFSFRKRLDIHGVIQSMSRRGNCHDNSPIETFFGILKDHLNLKNCRSIKDVKNEVTKQVNYYNYERPQLGLKKMPPSLFRRHLVS